MKTLRILSVRKNTDAHVAALEAEYAKRLSPHFDLKLEDIRKTYGPDETAAHARQDEARLFEKRLKPGETLIALDERGRQMTSVEFSEWLSRERDTGRGMTFLIGGPYGLDESLAKKAALKLSLSKMTFTHEMARLLLLEQLYRAGNISGGGSYHK